MHLPPALIRRLVLPLTRLHVPFVSSRLAWSVERHLADRIVSCRVRGVEWELDLNELIDHRIFYLGTHERFTTRRILESVPAGGVFFDVGANFGYFTMLVAKKLRGRGRVYAFEPMGRAMKKLESHVALNGFTNVVAEKVVLTDKPVGDVEIAFQNSWPVYGDVQQGTEKEIIPTTTLDAYIEEHEIARIDALKVDVDGYEYKVLSGASNVLRKLKPELFIELGSYTLREAGDSLEQLVSLIADAGYRFYSEMTNRPFRSTAEVLANVPPNQTINVVCRPE